MVAYLRHDPVQTTRNQLRHLKKSTFMTRHDEKIKCSKKIFRKIIILHVSFISLLFNHGSFLTQCCQKQKT